MARRPKTRADHLAAALEALTVANQSLASIDLRTVRGTLKADIKQLRQLVSDGEAGALSALQADVPPPGPTPLPAKSRQRHSGGRTA